jgi:hypothetical protein
MIRQNSQIFLLWSDQVRTEGWKPVSLSGLVLGAEYKGVEMPHEFTFGSIDISGVVVGRFTKMLPKEVLCFPGTMMLTHPINAKRSQAIPV